MPSRAAIVPMTSPSSSCPAAPPASPKVIPRLHAEYWYNAPRLRRRLRLGQDHQERVPGPGSRSCTTPASSAACTPRTARAAASLLDLRPISTQAPADCWRPSGSPTSRAVRSRPLPAPSPHPGFPGLVPALRRVVKLSGRTGLRCTDLRRPLERQALLVGRMFGMSEGLCMITPLDASPDAPPRHGRDAARRSTRSGLDPDSEGEAPEGEPGELCCRGPYTINGYYRSPSATGPRSPATASTAPATSRSRVIDGGPLPDRGPPQGPDQPRRREGQRRRDRGAAARATRRMEAALVGDAGRAPRRARLRVLVERPPRRAGPGRGPEPT